MSDLYIALCYIFWFPLGFVSPFVLGLGYVWVDVFYPQYLSLYLNGLPVSMVMGVAALVAYLILDRRSPPRATISMALIVCMAIWVTATTSLLAVAPALAWDKWDWAFKTIAFSAIIPFLFRSRVHIESFLHVYLFGLAIHIIPAGLKTIASGGGYGRVLTVTGTGTITEGSTMAATAIMLLPVLLYLFRHSILITNRPVRAIVYGGYGAICVAAALGTFARTTLIGFAVVMIVLWLQSRRKILLAIVFAALTTILYTGTSDSWRERMSTIDAPTTESSANGRILVWQWTLGFVQEHPFGGGFSAYIIDRIQNPDGSETTGKAFHSIYFEVLGEQGWVGLGILLTLIAVTIVNLRRITKRVRAWPQLVWCDDLARALLVSLTVIIACGAFVGIAYQPMIWYLFALSICLQQYLLRVEQLPAVRGTAAGRINARDVSVPVPVPAAAGLSHAPRGAGR